MTKNAITFEPLVRFQFFKGQNGSKFDFLFKNHNEHDENHVVILPKMACTGTMSASSQLLDANALTEDDI